MPPFLFSFSHRCLSVLPPLHPSFSFSLTFSSIFPFFLLPLLFTHTSSSLRGTDPYSCLYLSLPPLVRLVAPSEARISCLPGHHLFPGGNSELTCLRFKWMADDIVYRWCRPSCPASCPSSQCERPGVCMCSDVPCLMFGHVLPGDEVDVKVKGAVILPGGIGGALGTCEMGFEVSHGVSQFVVPFVHGQWVVPRTGSGATLACHRANNSSFSGLAGAPNETLECRSHFTCHDKPHIPSGMTLAHLE
ncbi:hypothetical protein E2C01_081680 [Portunus trituberculatus]|uniref:Sushi domain-containing protein n=1 Tax=Portunus trituberculatus TaxID=210409 RepID=A0A5B7J2Y8_PORTR|nr:hypothetical protein [Portunus trituberculatus]